MAMGFASSKAAKPACTRDILSKSFSRVERESTRNMRNWRKHAQAEPFLNDQIRGNVQQAQTLFAEAALKLAGRLIKLGLDERVKG